MSSRQLFAVVGGYFLLSLKIWYNRLIRATTNVQNKKKSWYVIIVIPSFLFGLEGQPLRQWRAAALALWFSLIAIISWDFLTTITFQLKKPAKKQTSPNFFFLFSLSFPMQSLYCNVFRHCPLCWLRRKAVLLHKQEFWSAARPFCVFHFKAESKRSLPYGSLFFLFRRLPLRLRQIIPRNHRKSRAYSRTVKSLRAIRTLRFQPRA